MYIHRMVRTQLYIDEPARSDPERGQRHKCEESERVDRFLECCAAIAQTHDAKLKVANQPGGGAVFSVEFPLAAGAPAPVSA